MSESGSFFYAGTIAWQDLVERGVPHGALWDLARAILLLFSKVEVKGWTTDSMLAIFEELIGIIVQMFSCHNPPIDM